MENPSPWETSCLKSHLLTSADYWGTWSESTLMKQKEQKLLTRHGNKEATILCIFRNAKEMQNQIWKLSCFQHSLWIFFFFNKKDVLPWNKKQGRDSTNWRRGKNLLVRKMGNPYIYDKDIWASQKLPPSRKAPSSQYHWIQTSTFRTLLCDSATTANTGIAEGNLVCLQALE